METKKEYKRKKPIINIRQYVESRGAKIKKVGNSTVCKCLLHAENTPSFFIDEGKGVCYCHSCHHGGYAEDIEAVRFNISPQEAYKRLCKEFEIKYSFKTKPTPIICQINKTHASFCKMALTHSKQGLIAHNYLIQRGLDDSIIDQFEIGFCPDDDSVKKILEELNYDSLTVAKSGLINKLGKNFFHNRIVIPIKDKDEDVIGFVGRAYVKDEKVRYMNTGETSVFNKSKNLFNENVINGLEHVYLCEGVFDVIAMTKSGLSNSTASLGTALTKEQCELLKSMNVKHVTIVYDGDHAGRKSTVTAYRLLKSYDFDVDAVLLPDNKDPDEYLKSNNLKKYVEENAVSLCQYVSSTMTFDEKHDKEFFDLMLNTTFEPLDEKFFIEFWAKRLGLDKKRVATRLYGAKAKENKRYEFENIICYYISVNPKNIELAKKALPKSLMTQSFKNKINDVIKNGTVISKPEFLPNFKFAIIKWFELSL